MYKGPEKLKYIYIKMEIILMQFLKCLLSLDQVIIVIIVINHVITKINISIKKIKRNVYYAFRKNMLQKGKFSAKIVIDIVIIKIVLIIIRKFITQYINA